MLVEERTIAALPDHLIWALEGARLRNPQNLRAYGNLRLLDSKRGYVADGQRRGEEYTPKQLDAIEAEAERIVLDGLVLVTGVGTLAQQRAAIVPLRWGSPRIVVVNCGMRKALGPDLTDEPFRAARLWRYQFDPSTDLVLSISQDDESGWIAYSPRVVRVVEAIARMAA